jgi:hypothetical protein
MDNLSIFIPSAGISSTHSLARAYPNPAASVLTVELLDAGVREARVLDMSGRLIGTYAATTSRIEIPVAALAPGSYVLQVISEGAAASMKFIKQ